LAEQTITDDSSLEEIIVTAQKRAERLIDVPVSIVALTADQLEERQVTSVADLPFLAPGLTVVDGGPFRYYTLRGIGNEYASDPSVGVYLDEANVTGGTQTQPNLSVYDLDRVEVLRGPQGTLYGNGASGGVIRLITKSPLLDRFDAGVGTTALFTADGAPSQRINAMVNVPVIDGQMGLRIAGTFDHEGGWIDQPAADRKNINTQNFTDVRIKDLWRPGDAITISAMAEIHRAEGGLNQGEDANGNYTQVLQQTTTPAQTTNFDIYNLTSAYDWGAVQLLNTASYVRQYQNVTNRGELFQYLGPIATTDPFAILGLDILNKTNNFNDELKLSSKGSGPWNWTLGGYFRRKDDIFAEQFYFIPEGPLPPNSATIPLFTENLSKSWAVFGNTDYDLTDRLSIGAGLREFEDRETEVGAGVPSATFHSLAPRAFVRYKITSNSNVYANAAKGFTSGGFNGPNQPTFGPENVWTYEIGQKTSLLEGQLSINADVFLSHYTDYQASGFLLPPAPVLNIKSNAGNATIKGVEADVAWHFASQWTLSFNGDYLHDRITKVNATETSYVVGDRLPFVAQYQFTTSLRRAFIVSDRPAYAQIDYSQQGPETYVNRALPWPGYGGSSDTIHRLDFHTGIDWTSNFKLGLFVQNLLDERRFLNPDSIEWYAPREQPRTYGIEFTANLK
jgi:iron complex outermembrane recepter protein